MESRFKPLDIFITRSGGTVIYEGGGVAVYLKESEEGNTWFSNLDHDHVLEEHIEEVRRAKSSSLWCHALGGREGTYEVIWKVGARRKVGCSKLRYDERGVHVAGEVVTKKELLEMIREIEKHEES